jgi:5'-3' exonuclease
MSDGCDIYVSHVGLFLNGDAGLNVQVLFKMDHAGNGLEIRVGDLSLNRELNFSGFTMEHFLEMCVLSGCDYLPSIPGIGVKKAHGYVRGNIGDVGELDFVRGNIRENRRYGRIPIESVSKLKINSPYIINPNPQKIPKFDLRWSSCFIYRISSSPGLKLSLINT